MSNRSLRNGTPRLTDGRGDRYLATLAALPDKGVWWVVTVCAVHAVSVMAGVFVLQPVLAFVFVLTCPGFVILDLDEEIPDLSARLLAAIAGSIGVNVVIGSLLLVAGRWTPVASTMVIALVSVAVALAMRSWRRPARTAAGRTQPS